MVCVDFQLASLSITPKFDGRIGKRKESYSKVVLLGGTDQRREDRKNLEYNTVGSGPSRVRVFLGF